MPDTLEWSDLQVFLAICARGSVGAAAQALGVNHSTVLRRVASLERTLAVRLFDRLPRGYALTEQGHELAASLEGVSEKLDDARRRVAGGDLTLEGTVRLTAPDTLIQALLLPLLPEFHARHPRLRLELVAGSQFLNLTQREADVALRGSNRPPDNLVGRRVGRIQTARYAAPSYLKTLGRHAEEDAFRWIGHEPALAHLQSAQWLRKHVPDDRIALRVDSLLTMADAVAAGLGVAWLLCPLGDARGLKRLEPPRPEFDTEIWVLTHPALKGVARVRALTGFLVEKLSGDGRLVR